MTAAFPLWPPRAGDVFFVRGQDVASRAILAAQAAWARLRGRELPRNASHVGFFLDGANVFETTPGITQTRSFARNYAGSWIMILRWRAMTPVRHFLGFAAVADQNGLDYPEGRLLAHLLGIAGFARTRARECSWLTASYLAGAQLPLARDPMTYDVAGLAAELLARPDVETVFEGSMRAAGLVTGSGADNRLVE